MVCTNILLFIFLAFSPFKGPDINAIECQTFTTEDLQLIENLDKIWAAEKQGKRKKAIAICTRLIESNDAKREDKVHYLIARSILHEFDKNQDEYEVDIEILKYLCKRYKSCFKIIENQYDISLIK